MSQIHQLLRATLVLVVAVALAGGTARPGLAQSVPDGVPDGAEPAAVTGHVDGDTFTVDLAGVAELVRLAGIDAPDSGECFAVEAAAWLVETLPAGATVYLERSGDDRDAGDRLLRYVWFQDEDGGNAQLLNSRLVRDGFAGFDARHDTPEYFGRIEKLEDRARDKGRGVWSACGAVHVPAEGAIAFEEEPVSAADDPEAERAPAEDDARSGFTVEEQAYGLIVGTYLETLGDSFGRFGLLMQNPRIGDDDWTIAVAAELATWKFIYDEASRLTPPPAFAEVHGLMLAGLAKFDEAADQIAYGIDYFDPGALNDAVVLLEAGNALIQEATDLLIAIIEGRTGGV